MNNLTGGMADLVKQGASVVRSSVRVGGIRLRPIDPLDVLSVLLTTNVVVQHRPGVLLQQRLLDWRQRCGLVWALKMLLEFQ